MDTVYILRVARYSHRRVESLGPSIHTGILKTMAKKRSKAREKKPSISKAAAIRAYMAESPTSGPSEVAEALNEKHGWSMSAQYVSTIKSTSKTGKLPRRGSVEGLLAAKKFANQVGGVGNAQQLLNTLADLQA